MANIKITDLTAYTDAASTDVLPIVDVSADVTKKIAIGDIVKAVPQGTVALPGLAFDGDPNTGIYSPGADQVAISTNGTGRLFVDSSGRIGIGSAPTYTLDVRSSAVGVININGGSGANQGGGFLISNSAVSGTNAAFADRAILFGGTAEAVYSVFTTSGKPLTFDVGASEKARITSDGKLGLGTSSPSNILEVSSNGNSYIRSTSTTNSISGVIGAATSSFDVGTTSSHAMNFYTAGVNRATLDTSGRLLVGTSSARSNFFNGSLSTGLQVEGLDTGRRVSVIGDDGAGVIVLGYQASGAVGGNTLVSNTNLLGALSFQGNDGNEFVEAAAIEAYVDGAPGANDMPGRLVFATTADGASSPTERMRINNAGNVGINVTPSTSYRLLAKTSSSIESALGTQGVTGDTATQSILVTKFDNDTTTSQNFIQFQVNNGGANCGRITANGANTAAFGSTSDIRLKDNIEDLPPQLEKILALRPVEFDYIESEGGGHQIGFIAQEMQQIYPDVVNERGEDDMLMITGWSKTEARLVKALQEAVAKIETLEAKVAALEGV
jgi:hypothetical protein